MRRLFLLRHAKSSWKDRELADHDRPLAPRGRRATKLIAEHLRQQSVVPAVVLCSSARRTLETLERISPALGEEVSVHLERELYAASEQSLLERLRGLEDGVESVLVIGHNPGSSGSCSASPAAARGSPQSRTSIRRERSRRSSSMVAGASLGPEAPSSRPLSRRSDWRSVERVPLRVPPTLGGDARIRRWSGEPCAARRDTA